MKEGESQVGISSGLQKAPAREQSEEHWNQKSLLQVLRAAPDAYLVLSPDLTIQLATDAYLAATLCAREDLVGKYVFDVFPDNPYSAETNAVKNLQASFNIVLESKKPDQMLLHEYDVPRPKGLGGGFEERYWSTLNIPVLNENSDIAYIIHKISDLTQLVKSQGNVNKVAYHHQVLQAAFDQLYNTQQKLEDKQRILEETQTLSHIGNFEAAFPFKHIYWSDELYRIHGLAPQSEEITLNEYRKFVHPDDMELYDKTLEKIYIQHEELNYSYRIICRDEATRFLHLRGRVVSNAPNRATRVNGTIQDITEQVQAQQKIRESEVLLREAEQVGHIGSYYGDIATLTFRFSEGMFRLLGLEPEDQVISLDQIDAASHPDDAREVRQVLEQAVQNKQPYEYLRRVYRQDGQMRFLHSTGKVKCDSDGNAVKFIGIVQDVTERKQAEKKIRQSELHFRTMIDHTPDVITRWDKDLKLVFNNRAFKAKTGLPVSSLYLNNTTEEGACYLWQDKLKQVFRTGETQDHYHSYAMPQETAYYHSRLVPEFKEDGTVQSVLVIARDISALKKLEQENLELRLSQQKKLLLAIMETQETERSRISESLHNGIGQLLYGAKLTLDQLTRNEITSDAVKLKASVHKTDSMLEQAIKQVRNTSHELSPAVLEHFGLEAALEEICATFRAKDLEFKCQVFNLQTKLEKHLQIAVYRFAQELANNIVKHAHATQASLLLREQNGMLLLLSKDNGKGFEPEHVQTKGIGMKSIQDRVNLLNGTLQIHSAPEKGTMIQISLPITT